MNPPSIYEYVPGGDCVFRSISLGDIPSELVIEMVQLLDLSDTLTMRRVCVRFAKIIYEAALSLTITCNILLRKSIFRAITGCYFQPDWCIVDNDFIQYIGIRKTAKIIPWVGYNARGLTGIQLMRLHICTKCKKYKGNVENGIRGDDSLYTIYFQVICSNCTTENPRSTPIINKFLDKRKKQVQRNTLRRPRYGKLNRLTSLAMMYALANCKKVVIDGCLTKDPML